MLNYTRQKTKYKKFYRKLIKKYKNHSLYQIYGLLGSEFIPLYKESFKN